MHKEFNQNHLINRLEYFDEFLSDGMLREQLPDTDFGTPLHKHLLKKLFCLGDYVFGFASKKDLLTWFSPVKLGYLFANGYEIWVYEVPKRLVKLGSRQLIFRFDDAISSNKINISTLRQLKD